MRKGIVIGLVLEILCNFGYMKVTQHIAKDKLSAVCSADMDSCQNLMNDYAMRYDGEE